MYGASAALRDPAAKACAGQSDLVSQYPEQGHAPVDIYVMSLAIDIQLHPKFLARLLAMLCDTAAPALYVTVVHR